MFLHRFKISFFPRLTTTRSPFSFFADLKKQVRNFFSSSFKCRTKSQKYLCLMFPSRQNLAQMWWMVLWFRFRQNSVFFSVLFDTSRIGQQRIPLFDCLMFPNPSNLAQMWWTVLPFRLSKFSIFLLSIWHLQSPTTRKDPPTFFRFLLKISQDATHSEKKKLGFHEAFFLFQNQVQLEIGMIISGPSLSIWFRSRI